MFYKDYIIFHVLDRCTRFHSGDEAKDKSEDTLIDLYKQVWVNIHGPFLILYVDGESGLTSPNARERLKRLGATVRVRAPEQHAQYIERRGRMFRLLLHKAEDQCKREGVPITFRSLLSE